MDECRKRLRKVGRKGVEGSSSDFYFASLDGNLVLDAGEEMPLVSVGVSRRDLVTLISCDGLGEV